jgi:hypothetical protein
MSVVELMRTLLSCALPISVSSEQYKWWGLRGSTCLWLKIDYYFGRGKGKEKKRRNVYLKVQRLFSGCKMSMMLQDCCDFQPCSANGSLCSWSVMACRCTGRKGSKCHKSLLTETKATLMAQQVCFFIESLIISSVFLVNVPK